MLVAEDDPGAHGATRLLPVDEDVIAIHGHLGQNRVGSQPICMLNGRLGDMQPKHGWMINSVLHFGRQATALHQGGAPRLELSAGHLTSLELQFSIRNLNLMYNKCKCMAATESGIKSSKLTLEITHGCEHGANATIFGRDK